MFKWVTFSKKQRMLFNWWADDSPVKTSNGIIADGSIRSGKTVAMALSFIMWAMYNFDGQNFIMAGKTIKSFQRNVLTPLKNILPGRKYTYTFKASDNLLTVSRGNRHNDFYIFGGKDEASQDLVQGMTAAGAYFDEVALMPESFVNQATGRCSVAGSKLWFNCNPEGPMHWFKLNWIDKAKEKGLLKLHFTMDDNLSLAGEIKNRYKAMYAGVFYLRYIKGLWAVAEGLIYSMFDDANLYDDETRPVGMLATSTRVISCDYGTTNPCVFLDIRDDGSDIWVENVWGWDSRSEEARRLAVPNKTDAEYADAMREFMTDDPALQCQIIVDPSAKSFITELRNRGFYVKEGDNNVLDGIRAVSTLMGAKKLHIHRRCTGLIKELRGYVWDEKAAQRGEEKPVKIADHYCDGLRYGIFTTLPEWRFAI
jgi:PBSX family phage terminase large subunit